MHVSARDESFIGVDRAWADPRAAVPAPAIALIVLAAIVLRFEREKLWP